jgi:hypothetical protein
MEDEALKAQVAALESIVIDKDAELETLKAKIEELKSTPAAAAGGLEVFSQGKKKYQFTAPAFVYGGKKITSAEAIKDKELLKALVDGGVGVIKEVQ